MPKQLDADFWDKFKTVIEKKYPESEYSGGRAPSKRDKPFKVDGVDVNPGKVIESWRQHGKIPGYVPEDVKSLVTDRGWLKKGESHAWGNDQWQKVREATAYYIKNNPGRTPVAHEQGFADDGTAIGIGKLRHNYNMRGFAKHCPGDIKKQWEELGWVGNDAGEQVQAGPAAQPAYAQPAYTQAAYAQAGQVAHTQPAYTQAAYTQAGQVAHTQPAYTQPAYTQAGQVAHTQPAYTQPAYTQPAYTQPAYTQPAYTQPAYTQPAYTQPAYTQPAYAQPAYAQPGQVAHTQYGNDFTDLVPPGSLPAWTDALEIASRSRSDSGASATRPPQGGQFGNLGSSTRAASSSR